MGEDVRETPGSSEEGRKRSGLWNKRKVRRKREVIMFEKMERKLVNVLLFFDLFKMKTKIPKDFTGVMRTQDRRVRKLVKKAYKIPFYKERFDKAGVKPEDIRTGDDLSKLPLLTKDELRAWMNEEAKNPKYERVEIGRASCRERV